MTRISGVSFDEAWASRSEAEVDGRTVAVIGRTRSREQRAAYLAARLEKKRS